MLRGAVSDLVPNRPGLLAPVVVAHVAVLVWMIGHHGRSVEPAVRPSLAVFDVAALDQPVAAMPAQPKVTDTTKTPPPTIINVPPVTPAAMILAAAPATLAAAPSGGCDLTDTVQAAVRESPIARVALASLPANARSVANAVMLWDGNWVEGRSAATRFAFDRLRGVVAATVASASPECQAQLQAGPRLIAVPGTPDTVLAIGSGNWRWADLDKPTEPATIRVASLAMPTDLLRRRDQ